MPKASDKRAKSGNKRLKERLIHSVPDETDSNTRDFKEVKHRFSVSSLILGLGPMVPKHQAGNRNSTENVKIREKRRPYDRDNKPEAKGTQEDNDSSSKNCSGTGSDCAVSNYQDKTNDCQTKDVAGSQSDNDSDATLRKQQILDCVDNEPETETRGERTRSSVISSDSGNKEAKIVQADDHQSTHTCKSDAAVQADFQSKFAYVENLDAPETISSGSGFSDGAAGTSVEKRVTFADEACNPSKRPASATIEQDGATSHLRPSINDMDKWSFSDDAFIRSMKDQGASWDLIASSIGRTKSQVRRRFFELKAAEANATDAVANRFESAESRTGSSRDTPYVQRTACKRFERDTTPPESYTPKRDFGGGRWDVGDTGDTDGRSYHDSEENEEEYNCSEEEAEEDADVEGEDDSSTSSATEEDDYDASDCNPFVNPSDPTAHRRERRSSERYFRHHIHPKLYPPTLANPTIHEELSGQCAGEPFYPGMHKRGKGKRDDKGRQRTNMKDEGPEDEGGNGVRSASFLNPGFSRRDRKLLAELRDRRAATQWLEMQANFFNATGRMIPLQLVKAKLEGRSPCERDVGPLARDQRRVADWTKGVAPGEDLIDPAQAGNAPQDAIYDDDADE